MNAVVGNLRTSRNSHISLFLMVPEGVLQGERCSLQTVWSPLIQGGLEIPVEVMNVEMAISEANLLAIEKYKALVRESVIQTTFHSITLLR